MPANDPAPPLADDDFEPDPIFVDSRREAGWILLMWASCFVWTLTVCLSLGYQDNVQPESFSTILGMPAWVVWGIGLPWLLADLVTIWFCLFRMKDGDLGTVDEESASAGEQADV